MHLKETSLNRKTEIRHANKENEELHQIGRGGIHNNRNQRGGASAAADQRHNSGLGWADYKLNKDANSNSLPAATVDLIDNDDVEMLQPSSAAAGHGGGGKPNDKQHRSLLKNDLPLADLANLATIKNDLPWWWLASVLFQSDN